MKLIRNLKVRTKLITSFLMVAILIGIVGGIGALSLKNVDDRAQEMYDISLQHVKEILSIKANMAEIKSNIAIIMYQKEPYKIEKYLHLYKISSQRAIELAKKIVRMTSVLGQEAIGFYGDPNRVVEKVGIGTGCICNPWDLYRMGADIVITVDDIIRSWEAGEWCNDTGFPAIVVNHAVSEIPAMSSLCELLVKRFPEIKITNIPQQSSYMTVRNK
jgi:hypothetical protein